MLKKISMFVMVVVLVSLTSLSVFAAQEVYTGSKALEISNRAGAWETGYYEINGSVLNSANIPTAPLVFDVEIAYKLGGGGAATSAAVYPILQFGAKKGTDELAQQFWNDTAKVTATKDGWVKYSAKITCDFSAPGWTNGKSAPVATPAGSSISWFGMKMFGTTDGVTNAIDVDAVSIKYNGTQLCTTGDFEGANPLASGSGWLKDPSGAACQLAIISGSPAVTTNTTTTTTTNNSSQNSTSNNSPKTADVSIMLSLVTIAVSGAGVFVVRKRTNSFHI